MELDVALSELVYLPFLAYFLIVHVLVNADQFSFTTIALEFEGIAFIIQIFQSDHLVLGHYLDAFLLVFLHPSSDIQLPTQLLLRFFHLFYVLQHEKLALLDEVDVAHCIPFLEHRLELIVHLHGRIQEYVNLRGFRERPEQGVVERIPNLPDLILLLLNPKHIVKLPLRKNCEATIL